MLLDWTIWYNLGLFCALHLGWYVSCCCVLFYLLCAALVFWAIYHGNVSFFFLNSFLISFHLIAKANTDFLGLKDLTHHLVIYFFLLKWQYRLFTYKWIHSIFTDQCVLVEGLQCIGFGQAGVLREPNFLCFFINLFLPLHQFAEFSDSISFGNRFTNFAPLVH